MNVDVVDPEEAALGLRLSGRLARPMARTEVESHSRRVRHLMNRHCQTAPTGPFRATNGLKHPTSNMNDPSVN